MPAHVERAELPGIGVRHDINTEAGRRLSVVSFRDGSRELAISDDDDPDRAEASVALTDDATPLGLLGHLLGTLGRRDEASKILAQLRARSEHRLDG